jgi:hypothetical protein
MWGLVHTNRKCNEHDKFFDHQMHLERIASAKPAIQINEPKKLPFLKLRLKKFQMEEGIVT